ncbi:MAG: type II toxin-antitoxin system VapC family toxin [Candidatus Latescibacteria bacterium]|nr:type II toxin-antitoxin system VapC family toxin [Candidatus Latescibacterota bacterium]
MTSDSLVVDTNVLVGLLDASDVWHSTATSLYRVLPTQKGIYCDIVINETITVLGRRMERHGRSADFPRVLDVLLQKIPSQKIVWIAQFIQPYYHEVIDTVTRFQGTVNFHDALIALYMRDNGLKYLLSFDADFDSFPYITRIKTIQDVQQFLTV